jgi:hypothetical protein
MLFTPEILRSFLQRKQIATLDELKQQVETTSTMTVFRKLKALGYRTSYSHRGKYYTLVGIPRFDEQGLWSCRGAWFSRYGNLLATAQQFVAQAPAGYTASELQALLNVEVKQALLELVQRRRLQRREIEGRYVYFAQEAGRQREQRLQREAPPAEWAMEESVVVGAEVSEELKAAIILFYSLLNEQQRRLYAGLEAHKVGQGGDRKIAQFLGLDVHTVARGRRELLAGEVERQRVRQAGGGRKQTEKKSRP